jgi:hypothetical protein
MNPLPSPYELASIAAQVATGSERSVDDYNILARRALAIWDGAGRVLEEREHDRELSKWHERAWPETFSDAGLESPALGRDYSLDDALKLLMPKRNRADRTKVFRDFLKETDAIIIIFGQSPEDAEGMPPETQIEFVRSRGFCANSLTALAWNFLPWLKEREIRLRSDAGRTGGKKRNRKKNEES